MTAPARLAVLISGQGTNLQAIIDSIAQDQAYPARIARVISNVRDAPGLRRAENAGIPTCTIPHRDFTTRGAFEDALHDELSRVQPDLIILAGFMRILSPDFVARWPEGRIVNIHPSLLPAYKGLDTHARVLADGVRETGCTVHVVTADLDDGPVLGQERVPVLPDDTVEILAERVHRAEHRLYPAVIRSVAQRLAGSDIV